MPIVGGLQTNSPGGPAGSRVPFVTIRVLMVCLLTWSMIATLQALAQHTDQITAGNPQPLLHTLKFHQLMYLPWMVFSVLLYGALRRIRSSLRRPRIAVGLLLFFSLAFVPLYEAYMVALAIVDHGLPWSAFTDKLLKHPVVFLFFDYFIFLGTFAFIYAIAVSQRTLRDEREQQRIEAEILALRLEVEQGRLAGLRAQLEPHFLFNALNALSALVRSGDQINALKAVHRLSELLRYAIAASGREWMTLAEEIAFVEDYLALQRLRFGPRLRFRIDGLTPEVGELECPPLLLQPLVENALRHDLETGSEASDIRLGFARCADCVEITLSNPVDAAAEPNGGLGIGLRNIGGRLALVYGERAAIRTACDDGRFVVALRLPLDAAEEAA